MVFSAFTDYIFKNKIFYLSSWTILTNINKCCNNNVLFIVSELMKPYCKVLAL